MLKLIVVNSNSSGNGYILQGDNESLIIECGKPLKEYERLVNYDISTFVACIVSHAHLDHSKFINQFLKVGIPVYSCQQVVDEFKGVNLISLRHKTKIGNFIVQPIPVQHSCECYAYLIEYKGARLVFATDLNSFPYRLKDINAMMIESNYDEDIIIDRLVDDNYSISQSENHLSISQAIDVLKENYSSALQNIILLHLSNGNSNATQFIEKVQNELGFDNVCCAEPNLIVELNKEEF